MEAKSLRIGNIIGRLFHNPNPNGAKLEIIEGEVKEIREETVNMTSKFGPNERVKIGYHLLKPIPLTNEWLLRFGFEHNTKYEYYFYNKFILDNGFILMDIDINVEVKTVHQLQNLFFSLTGEELTLKTE